MSQTMIEAQREALHDILCDIPGVKKVYFQPPKESLLKYPCILYELNDFITMNSDNDRYLTIPTYTVTLIDYNPESIIQKYIMDLHGDCHVSFDRFFTSDNLNHWVYKLSFSKSLW